MKTVEEVRQIYKTYQDKKAELDRMRAVLLEKQAEYKKLEDALIQKYGPDYAKVLAESVDKLELWISQGQQKVTPPLSPTGMGLPKQSPSTGDNPFGA